MTFTTIPGSDGAATTLSGTSGIDSVSITNSLISNFFVGAKQSNDAIALTGSGTRSSATMKGGQGADTFAFNGVTLASSFLNGNKDADVFGSAIDRAVLTKSTLQGGQSTDTIFVSNATDSIVNGNKQNDTLNVSGVSNNAQIFGGANDDVLTIGATAALTASLVKGDNGNDSMTVAVNPGSGGSFSNTTVQGGLGNDTVDGSTSTTNLLMAGGDGSDTVAGGTTADTLNGGAGADNLRGNAGIDQLSGGDGNDLFSYTASTELFTGGGAVRTVDIINGGGGTDSINMTPGAAGSFSITAANLWDQNTTAIESIIGASATTGAYTVTLNDAASNVGLSAIDLSADTDANGTNRLDVSAETATGYTLTGGAGIETIVSGQGADTISGGAGNDTVSGAGGNDNFSLGTANNTLDFSGGATTLGAVTGSIVQVTGNNGTDTITDYVVANDSIRLSRAQFGETSTGAIAALGAGKFSAVADAATPVNVDYSAGGFVYNLGTGQLFYVVRDMLTATSTNTDSLGELTAATGYVMANFTNIPTLAVGEFTVVA